ncbi:MAG: hypothetical protein K2Q09_07840 [Phycisphaerales bacterium]|nr:hypothetical protein [Phycisphaerales bacterium]
MRLSEIVNTVQAYRNLQQAVAGRALDAAKKNAAASEDLLAQLGLAGGTGDQPEQTNPADTVELSGQSPNGQSGADPLGAIVEGFYSQRQTYNFTVPGVGGMTSPVNVTWEVQRAYRVIQFVPQSELGQQVDQVA